jgi:hypothetical protein
VDFAIPITYSVLNNIDSTIRKTVLDFSGFNYERIEFIGIGQRVTLHFAMKIPNLHTIMQSSFTEIPLRAAIRAMINKILHRLWNFKSKQRRCKKNTTPNLNELFT